MRQPRRAGLQFVIFYRDYRIVPEIKSLIIATNNSGKLAELTALLYPIECIPQSVFRIESIPEDKISFVENALLKARHASYIGKKPALADDSGLVVPALNGEPGIFSARYAGEEANDQDNIALLLEKLKGIPTAQWQAYFYCAIVIVQHPYDPTPIIACGRIDGQITDSPLGLYGFGYDPVFYLPNHQCTMSQLPIVVKNTISHRAVALQQLRQQLKTL